MSFKGRKERLRTALISDRLEGFYFLLSLFTPVSLSFCADISFMLPVGKQCLIKQKINLTFLLLYVRQHVTQDVQGNHDPVKP